MNYILTHNLSHTSDTLSSCLLFKFRLIFLFVPRYFSGSFVWDHFLAENTFYNIYLVFSNFLTVSLLHVMVLGTLRNSQFIIFCKSINQSLSPYPTAVKTTVLYIVGFRTSDWWQGYMKRIITNISEFKTQLSET
jgi:hypothetical protein